MSILTTKFELVKEILSIENSDFLEKVASFIRRERQDFWDEMSDNEKQEIRQGIEELDNGQRVSFEEVLKKIS